MSLVPASPTNPAAYCSVRGVIGPGASSIVMKLPMTNWTQRYVQNGCGGECGNDNLGNPTQSNACVPVIDGELVTATTNMGHTGAEGRDVDRRQAVGGDRLRLPRRARRRAGREGSHQ